MSTCQICLNKIRCKKQLNCSHSFCHGCINKWRKNNNTCPICRTEIMEKEHSYFTRRKNNKFCVEYLKYLIGDFYAESVTAEKYIKINDIFHFLSKHPHFLKYKYNYRGKCFLDEIIFNKLEEFKSEGHSFAYYWQNKLYY